MDDLEQPTIFFLESLYSSLWTVVRQFHESLIPQWEAFDQPLKVVRARRVIQQMQNWRTTIEQEVEALTGRPIDSLDVILDDIILGPDDVPEATYREIMGRIYDSLEIETYENLRDWLQLQQRQGLGPNEHHNNILAQYLAVRDHIRLLRDELVDALAFEGG